MKVLLTSTDNPYVTFIGGKHIHLLLLEQGLKKLNMAVSTLYYNPNRTIELVRIGVRFLFSEKQRYRSRIDGIINYLMKHIPENNFDIVHAHDVLATQAVAKTPWKKLLTLHGYFARENIEFVKKEEDRGKVYPILLEAERQGMKNVDHIITVDQRLKEYVMSEYDYPSSKITIMHNAVDTDKFRPVPKEEQWKLKVSTGFSRDDFIVLVPRRLVEKNGVVYAVRALQNLSDGRLRMIIAGEGPEREKITHEANKDQRIRFVGMVPHDEIASYYMMADIILIPSITVHGIQEASSLAMLEGMACSKTVICSEIGGMREIIKPMENGVLIPEKKPTKIAKAIETISANPTLANEIGNNARDYVIQHHSYLAHARNVIDIYREILD
jgi:glycosyltransferase involved in cell wall biosynthesis